jgi:NAD(P)-dependent dehydrogenase (short-subunit alcohol dehydrogenase family)
MAGPIQGKAVVITGASSGIGRACVRAFAARGARLGLIARSREGLEAASREVRQAGGEAIVLPLDVADADAVDRAAGTVEERFGRIDVWVNNAMVSVLSPIKEMTPEEFRRVTEVTYLGYVWGTQAALRRMLPRDEGTIVQIGSALAYRSIPLQSAYCAAKAAIRGFTDSLRTELLHDGSNVRVSMLQLPAVNTPQFEVVRTRMPRHPRPVPPTFAPEMIADSVVWAAEQAPREMVIGASALQAILGQKLAPGLVDRYLAKTGYDAQQTDQPVDPNRPDNLFDTVPGDHGARGPFEAESSTWSAQLWARMHSGVVAATGVAVAAGALAASAIGKRR